VVLSYSQATGTQLAQRRLCGSALKSARLCGALSRAVTAVTGDGQYSLVASRIRSYALTGFHTVDHSIRSLVRYFVLLGATSAMGPLDILLAHGNTCGSAHAHTTLGRHAPCCAGVRPTLYWHTGLSGANIIAIDINRPNVWKGLLEKVRNSCGTVTFPVDKVSLCGHTTTPSGSSLRSHSRTSHSVAVYLSALKCQ
jgi:hypothetical protein